MIATLLLAAADPDGLLLRASRRIAIADPTPVAARSPYRLEAGANADPTSKDRAMASDGSYCNVVGARLCTSRPRTLLTAEITNPQ